MKDKDFGERLTAAKNAKQAMTAKFLQRPGHDDPAAVERRAARAAVSAARDVRTAERKAHAAAAVAEQAAQEERAAAEKKATDAKLEIERKAARDARYAARKARK
jgi:hypothetical protein